MFGHHTRRTIKPITIGGLNTLACLSLLVHPCGLATASGLFDGEVFSVPRAFSSSITVLPGEHESRFSLPSRSVSSVPTPPCQMRRALHAPVFRHHTQRLLHTIQSYLRLLQLQSNVNAFSFSLSAFCVSARDLKSSSHRLSMSLKASLSNVSQCQSELAKPIRCC